MCAVFMLPAQSVTILDETFEGAFPAGLWSTNGSPTWRVQSYKAAYGNKAAWCAASSISPADKRYATNMYAELTYGVFDLSDATSAELSYNSFVKSEESCDYFKVGIYYEVNGSWQWQEMDSQDGTEQVNWYVKELNLADFVGKPRVKLCFRFTSDNKNNSFAGAYVDNVRIVKTLKQSNNYPTETYHQYREYRQENISNDNNESYEIKFSDTRKSTLREGHYMAGDINHQWFRFRGVRGITYVFYSEGDINVKASIYEDNELTQCEVNRIHGEDLVFKLEFTPTKTDIYKLKIERYPNESGMPYLKYYWR